MVYLCFESSLRSVCGSFFLNAKVCGNKNRRGDLTAKLKRFLPNSFDSRDFPWHRRIVLGSMVCCSSSLPRYPPLIGVFGREVKDFVPERM